MTYDLLYTVDEHRLLNGVDYANGAIDFLAPSAGHFESIQPCSGNSTYGQCDRPQGCECCGFWSEDRTDSIFYHATFLTASFFYTHRVLELAYRRTRERFPDWLSHHWVPMGPGWRKIEFTSSQRKEAEGLCDRLVREIADSGEVSVSEEVTIGLCDGDGDLVSSVEQSRTPDGDSHRRLFLVANVPQMDDETQGSFRGTFRRGESFLPSPGSLRFGYEEIAPFLASLNPWLLSLANLGDGWSPLTELDLELFDAVSHSGIERAMRLVDQGANVNALDEDGNTPLTELGYPLWWNCRPDEADEPVRKVFGSQRERIRMMRRLLDRGADIDLFCFAGETPLCRAVGRGEYSVVRFLLAQGADPNHNHLFGEFPDDVSTALADAAPDDYTDPNSREAKTKARIHKALLDAGQET